eukprot:4109393-Amphidinium_carterae.1
MQITKGRTTQEDVFDIAEDLLDLARNGYGKSVVGAGYGQYRRGTRSEEEGTTMVSTPFLQATLKEINTRLEQGQPPVKKAPNFTIATVASLE